MSTTLNKDNSPSFQTKMSKKQTLEMNYTTFQLISYASNGDLDSLKKLFSENPDLDVNACDYDGRTALHLAAEEGI